MARKGLKEAVENPTLLTRDTVSCFEYFTGRNYYDFMTDKSSQDEHDVNFLCNMLCDAILHLFKHQTQNGHHQRYHGVGV